MVISSPQNAKLKQVRKLTRGGRRTDLFAAEGEDLVAAAEAAGWTPEYVLVAAGSGLGGEEVAPELLADVSSLGSGTRIIGVYRRPEHDPGGAPRPVIQGVAVCLWGVRDPGNVGTIVRSAHAFGADAVICGPNTADPYGPKAVRASMGSVFHVAMHPYSDVAALPGRLVALSSREGEPLHGPLPGPVTLVIGAERAGIGDALAAAVDDVRRIPIQTDSLNAAMAATVALYEATRS